MLETGSGVPTSTRSYTRLTFQRAYCTEKTLGGLLETNGEYGIVILLKQLFSRYKRALEFKTASLSHRGVCGSTLRKAERPQGRTAHFWSAFQASISLSGICSSWGLALCAGDLGEQESTFRRPGFHDWAQNIDTTAAQRRCERASWEDAPCPGCCPYSALHSSQWVPAALGLSRLFWGPVFTRSRAPVHILV